jgi:hypothetical protein
MDNNSQMQLARDLIKQKRYQEARNILIKINHPTAKEWIVKIDDILDDPFSGQIQKPTKPLQIYPKQSYQPQYNSVSEKSYIGASMGLFLFYMFFWLPGLIFNIMYLNEANRVKEQTGKTPAGMGCLQLMLLPNLLVCFLIILAVVSPR